jgi:hypothetical protein
VLIQEFEVDDANLLHLAERGIGLADLDAMLGSRMTAVRNKRSGSGAYKLIGRAQGGRLLTIVVSETSTVGCWRPITGWESTNAEQKAAK